MKFEIGDKVIVRHSNESGEVVDIINDQMVMVDVRGVKFPAYADQLDYPYYKQFTEKKPVVPLIKKTYIDQVPKEKNPPGVSFPKGMWLRFIPVFETDEFGDEVVTLLKLYLLNGSPAGFHFDYKVEYFGKTEFEHKNDLPANKDFYLHDIAFADLNDNPLFLLDCSLLQPDPAKASHFESSLKLKGAQLFKRIEEMKKKGEPSFSYQFFEQYPERSKEDNLEIGILANKGYKVYDATKARQHLPPARSVVDLHIEKIAGNWEEMDNYEILSLQLQEFEKYLELAQAHHLHSVIFIHGLGTGRLRDEIHEALRLKKGVKSFVNQYHPLYGYGATEVFLQY